MNWKSKKFNRIRKKTRAKPVRIAQTPAVSSKNYSIYSLFGGQFASCGEERSVQPNLEGGVLTSENVDFNGEFYEPNPEIKEAAFSHLPQPTKQGLTDSGVYSSLGDSNEEQEWARWWEEQQYIESHSGLLKTDKVVALAGIKDLRQKYF